MWRISVMTILLCGAAALPAAATMSGIADFPRAPDDGLPIILAQSTGGTSSGGNSAGSASRPNSSSRSDPPVPPPPPGVSPDAVGISPGATKAIVASIKDAADFCRSLRDPRLNVDCLSDQYRHIGRQLPFQGGYSGVRAALLDAAEKLHQLARDNYDGTPKTRANRGGRRSYTSLTPVKNLAKVNAKAAVIIEDTTLVLLRSSQGSDQRRAAYEEVAAVVNSNKVLLRSA